MHIALCAALLTIVQLGQRPPIPSLELNGKPFFPIGMYASTLSADEWPQWRRNGMNTVLAQWAIAVDPKTYEIHNAAEFDAGMRRLEELGMAAIISRGNAWTEGCETDRDARMFQTIAGFARKYPALLGYYTFDEPENQYWDEKYRGDTEKFHTLVHDAVTFAYDAIREADPDHYVMPCIGWWDMYQKLAEGYDVNLPNTYPVLDEHAEFEAPMWEVVYDARQAARAVRAGAGHAYSFCFTPQACDEYPGFRITTLAESRYMTFAPLTQGAMGIIYWTRWRSTSQALEQAIFPVTRQLRRIAPMLMAEWCDEMVSSDHDAASAIEALQELELPECSYCLRRSQSRYMLLAVNNTPNPKTVTFRLHIPEDPAEALEVFEQRRIQITDGHLTDDFSPFGVHVYGLRR